MPTCGHLTTKGTKCAIDISNKPCPYHGKKDKTPKAKEPPTNARASSSKRKTKSKVSPPPKNVESPKKESVKPPSPKKVESAKAPSPRTIKPPSPRTIKPPSPKKVESAKAPSPKKTDEGRVDTLYYVQGDKKDEWFQASEPQKRAIQKVGFQSLYEDHYETFDFMEGKWPYRAHHLVVMTWHGQGMGDRDEDIWIENLRTGKKRNVVIFEDRFPAHNGATTDKNSIVKF